MDGAAEWCYVHYHLWLFFRLEGEHIIIKINIVRESVSFSLFVVLSAFLIAIVMLFSLLLDIILYDHNGDKIMFSPKETKSIFWLQYMCVVGWNYAPQWGEKNCFLLMPSWSTTASLSAFQAGHNHNHLRTHHHQVWVIFSEKYEMGFEGEENTFLREMAGKNAHVEKNRVCNLVFAV